MIKVLKFGGASIKNAEAIENVFSIINTFKDDDVVIVFSALGKVTNMLEEVVDRYVQKSPAVYEKLQEVKDLHYNLINKIFDQDNDIFNIVNNLFLEIEWVLEEEPNTEVSYDYDQIVSVGELLSSNIISAFLKLNNF